MNVIKDVKKKIINWKILFLLIYQSFISQTFQIIVNNGFARFDDNKFLERNGKTFSEMGIKKN